MAIPNKKIVQIETIPTKYVNREWQTAFEKAQKNVIPVYCLADTNREALRKFVNVETAKWRIILHWVVKEKWCSKLKIPGGRKTANSLKTTGNHLKQILELCIQLHPISEDRYLYSDAANWFSLIIDEVKYAEVVAFVNRTNKGSEGESQIAKETCSNISGSLRGSEPNNPFERESEPHIWRLIESALKLADTSDRFRKTYWRDFLNSLAEINRKRKQGGLITLVGIDGKLIACGGQGRGKKTYL